MQDKATTLKEDLSSSAPDEFTRLRGIKRQRIDEAFGFTFDESQYAVDDIDVGAGSVGERKIKRARSEEPADRSRHEGLNQEDLPHSSVRDDANQKRKREGAEVEGSAVGGESTGDHEVKRARSKPPVEDIGASKDDKTRVSESAETIKRPDDSTPVWLDSSCHKDPENDTHNPVLCLPASKKELVIRRKSRCSLHGTLPCLAKEFDPKPLGSGERPISEPPMFNYDKFEREFIPSDKRLKLLYPNDVESRCKHLDLTSEIELLKTYSSYTKRTAYELSSDFLFELSDDIGIELKQVVTELTNFDSSTAGTLARWEYDHLDNDEDKTDFLQAEFIALWDVFSGCDEAREKYGHVCSRSLVQWEAMFLDPYAIVKPYLKYGAKNHPSLFLGCPEAQEKYEYLLKPTEDGADGNGGEDGGSGNKTSVIEKADKAAFPGLSEAEQQGKQQGDKPSPKKVSLKRWEHVWMLDKGPRAWIEMLVYKSQELKASQGQSIFDTCEEAKEKYGYLCAPTLQQWEKAYLDWGRTTGWIRKQLSKNRDPFYGCPDAAKKYGHLTPLRTSADLMPAAKILRDLGAGFGISYFLRSKDAPQLKLDNAIPTSAKRKGLEWWEYEIIGMLNGGPRAWIERRLYNVHLEKVSQGQSVFDGCPEAEAKYGHLPSPTLQQWEETYLDADGGTSWVRKQLLEYHKPFQGCPEAAKKYKDLIPSKLQRWEYRCLRKEGDRVVLEERYSNLSSEELFRYCAEAKEKYAQAFEEGALTALNDDASDS